MARMALLTSFPQNKQTIGQVFYGTSQRFFKLLCVSMKVDAVVAEVRAALAAGGCAVVGLQSTGEAAATARDLKHGDACGWVCVCRETLAGFIRHHFPTRVQARAV